MATEWRNVEMDFTLYGYGGYGGVLYGGPVYGGEATQWENLGTQTTTWTDAGPDERTVWQNAF